MKTSRYFTWLLVVALLLAALPVLGQDISLPQSYTFDSGMTFHYPEGAKVQANKDSPDFVQLSLKKTVIYVSNFPVFEKSGLTSESTLEDAAQMYIELVAGLDFDASAAEATEVDGREALSYPYVYKNNDWLLMLVRFNEDGAFAGLDTFGADESLVTAIAASMEASTPVTTSGGSCTVSVADEKTAQLRVGPGTNRTSYAFLPAKTEFTPLGRAEADDGSVWFQLDKDEVAPKAAASEAWVAAEAVETSGDCNNVGEASAPPIVPIVAAPPSNSSGGSSGSSGSIAPSPGTWTVSYASRGKGSCLDDAGYTYEFGVSWPAQVVSLSYTGSTVILGGSRMSQIQPNVYSGVFALANGNSFQLVISPVSPTQFSGEAHLTGVVDGHTCSNTVAVTVSKN